jgi:ferredoxin--NADP+ reductase
MREGRLPEPANPDPEAVTELIAERNPDVVSYSGWEAIDAAEKAAGEPHGRPRVKFTRVEAMLDASRSSA